VGFWGWEGGRLVESSVAAERLLGSGPQAQLPVRFLQGRILQPAALFAGTVSDML